MLEKINSILAQILFVQVQRQVKIYVELARSAESTAERRKVHEPETPRLLQYNDTLHLGPVGKWGEERRQAGAAVLALMADEQAPAGYTPTEQAYTLGRDEGAHHDDPLEAIGELARRHGGERVTLRGEGDALRELVHRILARPVTVGPAGVTHVVASERGHTLADFNCADLPPRG